MPSFGGWFSVFLALLLLGCSSQGTVKDQVSAEQLAMVSREGKKGEKDEPIGTAPGMIPANCEALLNKSQAWGYIPGQKWKASSPEQMIEVARFFGEYRLVPEVASEALRVWENGGPAPGKDLQFCDVFLAQTFLQSLIEYNWGKAERLEAGKLLHRFMLNQQALSLPLAHRALSAQIFVGGVKRGLIPGSRANANALGVWVEKEIVRLSNEAARAQPQSGFEAKEMKLSSQLRNRIGALLPLP